MARSRQRGFTYLGLLFAVAVIGITLATVGVVWSAQIRRDKETELLFSGDQIRAAIGRYYIDTPSGVHSYPPSLQDLLQDDRWPQVHRHLRRLYVDPMTASTDWQVIAAPEGGVMGVVSTSTGAPIKKANFIGADRAFENAECYCNWLFVYRPNMRARIPARNP
ncbi:MAG: type II secretion system protein [Pseudomonadota bacterium]